MLSGLWLSHLPLEISSGLGSFHQRKSFHLALANKKVSIIYLDLNSLGGISSLFKVDSESAWHKRVFLDSGLLFGDAVHTLKVKNDFRILENVIAGLNFDGKSSGEVAHVGHFLFVHIIFLFVLNYNYAAITFMNIKR